MITLRVFENGRLAAHADVHISWTWTYNSGRTNGAGYVQFNNSGGQADDVIVNGKSAGRTYIATDETTEVSVW